MDATGQLWQSGALVGKPVTFVTSTASQGGGQEVTILSSEPPLAHFCDWPVVQEHTCGEKKSNLASLDHALPCLWPHWRPIGTP